MKPPAPDAIPDLEEYLGDIWKTFAKPDVIGKIG